MIPKNVDYLESYPNPKDKRKKLYKDTRSFIKGEYWQVHPVSYGKSGKTVNIVCPFCGNIHTHGNASGHRVSHCLQNDNPGYEIVL